MSKTTWITIYHHELILTGNALFVIGLELTGLTGHEVERCEDEALEQGHSMIHVRLRVWSVPCRGRTMRRWGCGVGHLCCRFRMVVSCWHETDGSLRLLLSAVPVFNEFCYMLIATSCCSQLHRIRRYPISAVAMSRRVGLTV